MFNVYLLMFNKKKTHRSRDEPFCIFTYVYTAMSLATC